MKKNNQPLVVANWKMNPQTLAEAKTIFHETNIDAKKNPTAVVVVAPPSLYLIELVNISSSTVALAAQTMHSKSLGAFTGEIAPPMIANCGVKYVIIGHSERRAMGETDVMVAQKILAALKALLIPIVCIGEHERDIQGNFFMYIETQIATAIAAVPKTRFKDIIIAYEPIWAIGTGATATVEDIKEMQLFIFKVLTKYFGATAAHKVRILYGGSVKGNNAATIFADGGVNGFLVGGASLRPKEFAAIIASTII